MDHSLAFPLLVGLVALALAFDFLNGLHDAANAIATVVATRLLSPVLRFASKRYWRMDTMLSPASASLSKIISGVQTATTMPWSVMSSIQRLANFTSWRERRSRFSMTRSSWSSMYSMREMGT